MQCAFSGDTYTAVHKYHVKKKQAYILSRYVWILQISAVIFLQLVNWFVRGNKCAKSWSNQYDQYYKQKSFCYVN